MKPTHHDREPSERPDSPRSSAASLGVAERVYLEFAEAAEGLGAVEREASFEALCAAHPEHAAELRRLRKLEGDVGRLLDGGRSFFRAEASGAPAVARKAEGFARSFEPGQSIGDFKLVRFLGHGGMGQVWEAEQLSMRRSVALKLLLPGRCDERTIALFEREARAGGRANHPNLVRTLARGTTDGIEWIAQELVEGSFSLREAIERLRRESAAPKDYYLRCAKLVQGIAEGLQAAHEAGVIHRDLKPQNILIDSRDTPRVADFGLARVEGDTVLSKSGDIGGTYQYMSPEQVSGARSQIDHRTDVFSLGVVLYELLTLQRPFSGDTTQQIASQIAAFDPPEPSKLRAQCPRELSVITLKAMQKRSAARYATMRELAEDLGRFLRNEPILAKPATRLESARKWVQRNPAPSVGMGVGAAALAVISGVAIYAVDQAEQRREEALRAERGEAAAKENLELAQRNASEASRNAADAQLARDEALATANDVLALSAQKECDDLTAEVAQLWPANDTMIQRYEEWLRRTRELVDGRPADPSRDIRRRPSLVEHKAKLAALRLDAMPLTDEQRQAERTSHPKFKDWTERSAQARWMSRMLGLEPWPTPAETEAEISAINLPTKAEELNALAWTLVDPKQPAFGSEAVALLLASRALEAATESTRVGIRDTYAWALYRNGKLDEAQLQMKLALAEPGGDALRMSARDLDNSVKLWRSDRLLKTRAGYDELVAQVASLAAQLEERRTYQYVDADKVWWDRQLLKLIDSIEALSNPMSSPLGDIVAERFGWGIPKRLAFARSVRERTVTSPEAKRRWDEALQAIAQSERYRDSLFPGGKPLTPQEGLLPLGADPQSGLWEFWHVQSGDEPPRGEDGKFLRQESGAHRLVEANDSGTGIVLVLLPGGTFWMGAQATDPKGQNYDPEAASDEGPVHRVTLSPYFMAKYELTQGQWARFTGVNPAYYKSGFNGTIGPTNPVEQVDWFGCDRVMRELGLELPSEAQWEFACRAGSQTPWSSGDKKESLLGMANLADRTYVQVGGYADIAAWWPEFNDGHPIHAPAGRMKPNAFGIHDMQGNVWEWCFDEYIEYPSAELRDPRVDVGTGVDRVNRGGAFFQGSSDCRSANRGGSTPDYKNDPVGMRAARAVQP
jgi:serine/threonine protein kinase/formylglycine-generating enzyme required for sulfatase activity